MTPRQMLDEAQRMLRDPNHATDTAWARSAAFLAREALEQKVRQVLIREWGLAGYPSFRSQLLASRAFLEEDLARQAAWTWTALSQATHHHAYELPPTAAELMGWLATVEGVVGDV